MATFTHLTDLIELPTQQRQVVQLLLRKGTMLASDLRSALRILQESLSADELDEMFAVLETQGWLVSDRLGDEPRYRVGSLNRTRKPIGDIWQRLALDADEEEAVSKPAQPRQKASDLLDALNDKINAPSREGMARRGGKRTLPDSLWDKLDSATHPVSNAEGEQPPATASKPDLWEQLAKRSDPDSS